MQIWGFQTLCEMLLLSWRSCAAGGTSSTPETPQGKTTATSCTVAFCLWLSGHEQMELGVTVGVTAGADGHLGEA